MVKKLLFLMTMSVGMIFPTMAQNIPSYVPTNGLVGWWPFNGNANDESGNGKNGVLNSGNNGTALYTIDRNGFKSAALSFSSNTTWNSLGPYVEIMGTNTLNLTAYSINIWIKPSTTCLTGELVNKGPDNVGFLSRIQSPLAGIAFGSLPQYVDYPFSVSTVQWTMLTFNRNISGNSELFINGSLVYTSSSSTPKNNNFNFAFGAMPSGGTNGSYYPYQGLLDDIAIYNRSLTQQEVTALFTGTTCTNPTATITPEGNTTFCQGGFVNLNASTGINYTYQWYNNGQIINGATASIYQANTAGNYSVKVMDGTCNTTSSATTIVVNQYPSSNVQISGNTTICEGSTVTLTAQGFGSYLWSNGSTSQSIKVNQTGSYNVAVTQNGCTSNSSSTSITVNPNPTASITPQGNTTFCQGGFVNLVANGGTIYQWNTGSNNSTISANQSGTYTVNVFNSFGCQATASQSVTVNTNPTVTFNGLNEYTLKNQPFVQLTGTPAGGTFIGEGIQGSTFTPANVALGKKTITYNYTSPQGCSGSATRSTFVVDSIGNVCSVTKYDTVTITNNVTKYDTILKLKFKLTTGVSANQMTSMTLYPNPTTDVLNVSISDAKALEGYHYRILDAVGKEVYNQLVKNPITEIPLKSLGAAGMYLFEVIDQQNKTIQSNKIVLE